MPDIIAGVSYYPDHWPEADWARDLQAIKQCGMDCVRFGEFSWSWFEPEPGQFDFRAYDRFMDLVHQCGLQVVLCTPTAAPPEWLLQTHPNVRWIDAHGIPHGGSRHMVCFSNPDFLRLARRAIVALAERYKHHPALAGWQIDNEPTLGESADDSRVYDYSPAAKEAFQTFLKDKYATLEALNAHWLTAFWSRSYTSWAQIAPPTRPSCGPSIWLDWMRFRQSEVTRFIAWQRDILRSIGPDFTIGSNMPECGPLATAWLGQDFHAQSAGLSYVGTDIYCYDAQPYPRTRSMAYSCDLVASMVHASGAEFWISETPGGPHFSAWRTGFFDGHWDDGFLRESVLNCAAHGAKRVLFFLWRAARGGQEFGMNGLTNMDGSLSVRASAIRSIIEEVRRQPPVRRPMAYIHYSWDSIALSAGFDPDRTADDCYHGWYALLADLGYQIAFVDDPMLACHEWALGDVLVLAHTMVVSPSVAAAIQSAASAGCTILGGYATGLYDEYGCFHLSAPGAELDKLFGLRIESIDHLPAQHPQQVCAGTHAGLHFALVSPTDAKPCGLDTAGMPLAHQNGRAFYFAFDVGATYAQSAPNPPFLTWFAEATGLQRSVPAQQI